MTTIGPNCKVSSTYDPERALQMNFDPGQYGCKSTNEGFEAMTPKEAYNEVQTRKTNNQKIQPGLQLQADEFVKSSGEAPVKQPQTKLEELDYQLQAQGCYSETGGSRRCGNLFMAREKELQRESDELHRESERLIKMEAEKPAVETAPEKGTVEKVKDFVTSIFN